MTFSFSLLVVLVLCGATTLIVGDEFRLESPHITNWGQWGEIEHCPPLHYVYGMRIKIQPPAGIFVDDTALNGVELLCATKTQQRHSSNTTVNKEFASIVSSIGHKGGWTHILECPMPTFAIGFQLRSEPNQLVADDTAGNDLKLFCSNGFYIGGFDVTDFGDWTLPQSCPRGMSICGLQTQVEAAGNSDETTLNNVNMWCCE